MIVEVTMYRAVCDEDGCDKSPSDGGDYFAWSCMDGVESELDDSGWIVRDGRHLCPDHHPRCAAPDCDGWLSRWDEGDICEDCAHERSQAKPPGDAA